MVFFILTFTVIFEYMNLTFEATIAAKSGEGASLLDSTLIFLSFHASCSTLVHHMSYVLTIAIKFSHFSKQK